MTPRVSAGACLLCGHSCANVGWQDGSLCRFARVNEGLLCMGDCGCYWRWIGALPHEEMPAGPASGAGAAKEQVRGCGSAPAGTRFLVDLEAVEDAVAQFVSVSCPDLIDAEPGPEVDFLYDRLTNTLESLRTAMHALWCARAGL